MAWYDGTEEIDFERFDNEFSVAASDGIYFSADFRKMAIVNSFEEGTPLFELADPHAENDDYSYVFYHVITGKKAKIAGNEIKRYVKVWENEEEIYLFRVMKDKQTGEEYLLRYAKGHICRGLISDNSLLENVLPDELKNEKHFIVPLKRYAYPCPVCMSRTLSSRGMYEICTECGWEDGLFANDCSADEYREKYLQVRKEHPEYDWMDIGNTCMGMLYMELEEEDQSL